MKYLTFHKDILHCEDKEQVFKYLLSTLKPSCIIWSYFVDWQKVFRNTSKIELALNEINFLIGKEDFDASFKYLVKQSPRVIKILPALVVRSGKGAHVFKILVDYKSKKLVYEDYDFSKTDPTDEDIEKYLIFVKESGLKELLVSKRIKNLVDYMIGIEAGLDSHGRKNRGGKAMETIVEVFVADVCNRYGYKYLRQGDAKKIKQVFRRDVPVDKSSRRYDFVVDTGAELILIETNFYGGGGSKLKSTAGEYRNLFDVLNGKYKFIWITDGMGWKSTARPLRETFDHNDYILNLSMLENSALEFVIDKPHL